MTEAALKEYAPAIAPDHMPADPRRIRDGLVKTAELAFRTGDYETYDQIKGSLERLTSPHMDRPKLRYDPLERFIQERHLRRAVDALRNEAERNYRALSPRMIAEPIEDDENERERTRKELKEPPASPDPINRWRIAHPVGAGECPRTFAPKNIKRHKSAPRQFIAERVYAAARDQGEWRLWRIALDGYTSTGMKNAIAGMILDRMSLRDACLEAGLSNSGRNLKLMKANVTASIGLVAAEIF